MGYLDDLRACAAQLVVLLASSSLLDFLAAAHDLVQQGPLCLMRRSVKLAYACAAQAFLALRAAEKVGMQQPSIAGPTPAMVDLAAAFGFPPIDLRDIPTFRLDLAPTTTWHGQEGIGSSKPVQVESAFTASVQLHGRHMLPDGTMSLPGPLDPCSRCFIQIDPSDPVPDLWRAFTHVEPYQYRSTAVSLLQTASASAGLLPDGELIYAASEQQNAFIGSPAAAAGPVAVALMNYASGSPVEESHADEELLTAETYAHRAATRTAGALLDVTALLMQRHHVPLPAERDAPRSRQLTKWLSNDLSNQPARQTG